jgi:dUTP pyrophosphatase
MDNSPVIGVKTVDKHLIPFYATALAAGADIKAHIEAPLTIEPGTSVLIPTGLYLDIPSGYEIQIRPRSGLALKHGITVLNTPGTIDADYKGQIGVILINHSRVPFVVEPLMRIAQMVCAKVEQATFVSVDELSSSTRGSGGFGSSGLK